jgi:UDP-glucose 4-epimerase
VRFGVRKVIFASTGGAIYGELERMPADESYPVRPLSPYGIDKHVAEHYLRFYRDRVQVVDRPYEVAVS